MGDNQGAIADFNQALKIQPEDALVYIARGNAYRQMGNYFCAVEDYTKSLSLNPENPHAYHNRAIAYTNLEEMLLAVDDYQQAIRIFCDKEDWDNFHKTLNNLKKINTRQLEPQGNKSTILRQRLLRLVGGYWEIAERLILQAKYHYPEMSEEWYMEKVISDLERERGMW